MRSLVLLEKKQLQGVIQGDWCQWTESKSNICSCLTELIREPGQRAMSSTNLLLPSRPPNQIAPGSDKQ